MSGACLTDLQLPFAETNKVCFTFSLVGLKGNRYGHACCFSRGKSKWKLSGLDWWERVGTPMGNHPTSTPSNRALAHQLR